MELKVISLKGVQYEGQVKSVNAKTTSGEITVMDHHLLLMTVLEKGRLVIKDTAGQSTTIPTASGFLEVGPHNTVKVLVD